MSPQRLFLEKRSYRMRRLLDLAKVLPIIGFLLWMVPLMWSAPAEETATMGTGEALAYIFGVWAFLVLAALLLWFRTRDIAGGEGEGKEPAEGG